MVAIETGPYTLQALKSMSNLRALCFNDNCTCACRRIAHKDTMHAGTWGCRSVHVVLNSRSGHCDCLRDYTRRFRTSKVACIA
jgi:hypothetical protein